MTPAKGSVFRAVAIDHEVEDRILALDPEHISEADVAATLSKAPAPQIMLLHGGIYPVHVMMESTGKFLVGMGYPEARIRQPGDRRWSHNPYEDSAQLAGLLAWYYEQEGVRPMIIGHSQGGIQAVKILYEIAGQFQPSIPVLGPLCRTKRSSARPSSIRSPAPNGQWSAWFWCLIRRPWGQVA